MKATLAVINQMQADGVIGQYAIVNSHQCNQLYKALS